MTGGTEPPAAPDTDNVGERRARRRELRDPRRILRSMLVPMRCTGKRRTRAAATRNSDIPAPSETAAARPSHGYGPQARRIGTVKIDATRGMIRR